MSPRTPPPKPSKPAAFMRAVQYEGNVGDVAVNIVPRPTIEQPEDAIVRITSSAICGSDLHIYHGIQGDAGVPFGIGHEAVGIVEEVGDAVDFFKPGDRVIVVAFTEDGHLLPKPTMTLFELEHMRIYGHGETTGLLDHGLQAEYARVPWADSSLAKIPSNSNLDDREWLPVADVFPTGWSLLTRSGFEPGDSVAIFGAGAVGLMCAYSAIMRGASIVYVIDHVTSRLAKATQIGAMAINFTLGGKASDQILALRPAGVKRTVDCVGEVCLDENLEPRQDYVLREAVKITRHQGGIGVAGVYMAGLGGQVTEAAKKLGLSPEIKFPIAEAWSKELRIHCGMVDLKEAVPQVMELIKSGRARPGFIFSNEYSIDDAPLAYSRFERWEESKVILKGARKKGDEKSLEIRNGSSGHGRNGSNTEA